MELSSGCSTAGITRPAGRPVRGPHGGWQKQEIEALQKGIDEAGKSGESLRSVFDRLSTQLGRKPNSIRNFYYAQVRAQPGADLGRALPFETFTQSEVEQLVEHVLTARAQGLSVRACVRSLADGDRTRMLRYQNKYRSTVRTRPELVHKIMDRLSQDGIPFVSPYSAEDFSAADAMSALHERAEQCGDPQLPQLFASLDHLMNLAFAPHEPAAAAASDAQRKADRLGAQVDMLRIALDDEQIRRRQLRRETEGMVTLIKEYIALSESDRLQHAAQFCHQAAERLNAVECAMMESAMMESAMMESEPV